MTQLCLPGNALTPHVLEGARFSAGAIYNGVGTMKDRGGQEVAVPSVYMQEGYLSVSPSDIPAGTWNAIDSGTEFVYRDALHVSAKNIMKGFEMLGLDGTATSDATATASEIISGKTAYVNGVKLTGTGGFPSPVLSSVLMIDDAVAIKTNKQVKWTFNLALPAGKQLGGFMIYPTSFVDRYITTASYPNTRIQLGSGMFFGQTMRSSIVVDVSVNQDTFSASILDYSYNQATGSLVFSYWLSANLTQFTVVGTPRFFVYHLTF